MERKEVINQLIKDGGVQTKNIIIKNVTVTPMEEYVRLGLTLDTPVKGYRLNEETNEWEEQDVNVIFVSAFSVASLMKENPAAAFAANTLLENPKSMSVVLSRAKITVIAENVAQGQEYVNPWSNNTDNSTVFEHDTIIHHVVDLEISDFGKDMLRQLALNMMGIK